MSKDKVTHVAVRLDEYRNLKKQAKRLAEYDKNLITQEDNKHYVSELQQQNKRYRLTVNAMQQILKDAIHSLDVGKKVQGLEYGVKMADEALEGEE